MDAINSLKDILNERLFNCVQQFTDQNINEIRIRNGLPLVIICGGKTFTAETVAGSSDIQYVIEHAAKFSIHSHKEQICRGFIDYNGLRIGLCGTAVNDGDKLSSVIDISSLNVRVPSEIRGIFDEEPDLLLPPRNTLIISPPGCGKTTALRELIRLSSDLGYRTSVADERNEIAAKCGNVINFYLGRNTDVITNMPKTEAVSRLLRAMNPQIIALDELSGASEISTVKNAALSGVIIFATAHGKDSSDAAKLDLDFFERYISISVHNGKRVYRIDNKQ